MNTQWHHWTTKDHGAHALAFWHDVVCAGVINAELSGNDEFVGTMSSQTRVAARMVNFSSSPHTIRRSQRHVSRLDDDYLMLGFQCQGRVIISQGDDQVCLQAGEFGLLDASLAFDLAFPEPTARRLLLLPRHMLGSRAPGLRRLRSPVRLDARMPLAPVLAETMHVLTDATLVLEDQTVNTLLESVVEIVAVQCAPDAYANAPTALTFMTVKRHIHAMMTDPELSPASVAAACRISVRTLHRSFARYASVSFEAYLVQARLARAYDLIAAGKARTVSEAAFACGFNNLSHFTRRFSERYSDLPVHVLRQHQH